MRSKRRKSVVGYGFFIYLFTNTLDRNKKYVGEAVHLQHRWNGHLSDVKSGDTRPLYVAMREFGIEAFTRELIEVCDSAEAMNRAEAKWIAFYKSSDPRFGYNLTKGGGQAYTDEARHRLSVAQSKPETRRKKSESHKKWWEEHPIEAAVRRRILSERNQSEEQRVATSTGQKALWADPEVRAKWIEGIKRGHSSQETRDLLAEAASKPEALARLEEMRKDPEVQARRVNSITKSWTQERRAEKAAATRKVMENPEMIARISAKIQASLASRSPEKKAQHVAAIGAAVKKSWTPERLARPWHALVGTMSDSALARKFDVSPTRVSAYRREAEVPLLKAPGATGALTEVIKRLGGKATLSELEEVLGLSKSTTVARLSRAVAGGFLVKVSRGVYAEPSEGFSGTLNDMEVLINAIKSQGGRATLTEVMGALRLPKSTVASRLSRAVTEGYLVRVSYGVYAESSEGLPSAQSTIEAIIVMVRNQGKSTPSDVRRCLGLSEPTAAAALQRAVSKGHLVKVSRGVYAIPEPAEQSKRRAG